MITSEGEWFSNNQVDFVVTVQSGLFGSLASTNRNISPKWNPLENQVDFVVTMQSQMDFFLWIRIKWITHVQVSSST